MMSPLYDYQCRKCGCDFECFMAAGIDMIECRCEKHQGCRGTADKQWTPPHTGRGSSGEPPR